MKYMIIIYGNEELWASFPAEEAQRAVAAQGAFNLKYKETGELLGAYGTADAVRAKTVRVQDGARVVTDGPYLETKEHLASWYLVDVEDEERALDLAAEIPFASVGAVEVWPLLHEAPGSAL